MSITGMSQGISYFHEVHEIKARAQELYGKGLRVSGNVQPGSIRKTMDHKVYDFLVTDGKSSLPIHFEGIVPDLFKDGAEVVIEGRIQNNQSETLFLADNLMAKCPSKFEAQTQERAGGEGVKL